MSIATLCFVFLLSAENALGLNAEDQAQRLSEEVMSPYCPGRTLAACPSEDARKLRDELISWYQNGATDAEARQRLQATYGAVILAEPENSHDKFLAVGVIVAGIILGLIVLMKIARRRTTPQGVAVDPELSKQIELELKHRLEGR